MTRRVLAILLALAALGLGVGACGGGDDEESDEPAATDGGGGGQTIEIAADPGGDLAFDQTELTASAGEITIEFTNDASIPHNFTLEDVDGGATATISGAAADVTVTLEPGTYTFFCSVGGHRAGGMEGTLTVE
jgi:plastocyanin